MPSLTGYSYTHDHGVPPIGLAVEVLQRNTTHKWQVTNKITRTHTHKWNRTIRVVPDKTKTHKWNVTNKIVRSKKHIWDAGGRIKRNRFHLWNITVKLTNVTHTHKYNILLKRTRTKTHKYNLIGKLVRSKTHKWNSAGRIYDDVVKRHKFNIIAKKTLTKTHKWNILAPQMTATDIQYYKSTATNSLGGAINTGLPITDNIKANLFDTVTATESSSGETEYRCLYLKNISTRSILANPKVWLVNDSVSPYSVIAIGLGSSAINGTEQTIGAEETAPSSVTFTTLTGIANALSIGSSLTAGQHKAVWIRRVISSGSGVYDSDNFQIGWGGDTMADV